MIQMIITILIIAATVLWALIRLYRVINPKNHANNICPGNCASCSMSQHKASKIVFKLMK